MGKRAIKGIKEALNILITIKNFINENPNGYSDAKFFYDELVNQFQQDDYLQYFQCAYNFFIEESEKKIDDSLYRAEKNKSWKSKFQDFIGYKKPVVYEKINIPVELKENLEKCSDLNPFTPKEIEELKNLLFGDKNFNIFETAHGSECFFDLKILGNKNNKYTQLGSSAHAVYKYTIHNNPDIPIYIKFLNNEKEKIAAFIDCLYSIYYRAILGPRVSLSLPLVYNGFFFGYCSVGLPEFDEMKKYYKRKRGCESDYLIGLESLCLVCFILQEDDFHIMNYGQTLIKESMVIGKIDHDYISHYFKQKQDFDNHFNIELINSSLIKANFAQSYSHKMRFSPFKINSMPLRFGQKLRAMIYSKRKTTVTTKNFVSFITENTSKNFEYILLERALLIKKIFNLKLTDLVDNKIKNFFNQFKNNCKYENEIIKKIENEIKIHNDLIKERIHKFKNSTKIEELEKILTLLDNDELKKETQSKIGKENQAEKQIIKSLFLNSSDQAFLTSIKKESTNKDLWLRKKYLELIKSQGVNTVQPIDLTEFIYNSFNDIIEEINNLYIDNKSYTHHDMFEIDFLRSAGIYIKFWSKGEKLVSLKSVVKTILNMEVNFITPEFMNRFDQCLNERSNSKFLQKIPLLLVNQKYRTNIFPKLQLYLMDKGIYVFSQHTEFIYEISSSEKNETKVILTSLFWQTSNNITTLCGLQCELFFDNNFLKSPLANRSALGIKRIALNYAGIINPHSHI